MIFKYISRMAKIYKIDNMRQKTKPQPKRVEEERICLLTKGIDTVHKFFGYILWSCDCAAHYYCESTEF